MKTVSLRKVQMGNGFQRQAIRLRATPAGISEERIQPRDLGEGRARVAQCRLGLRVRLFITDHLVDLSPFP